MTYLELDYWNVALAALLIVVNAAISVALKLGLEKSLLIASARTVVQLLLIGVLLEWIFSHNQPWIVIVVMLIMTLIAGITATSRLQRRYQGIWFTTLLSMWASSWLVGGYAMLLVFRGVEHWYQPQYAIPLLGMILGNTLNGISIGLNTFLEATVADRDRIEMRLSLGANRWEAGRPLVQQAVRTGMIPIINSMMIVGLVSLPGMMTGQLLAGASPLQAVRYQIVIMFLIASATAIGTVSVVLFGFLRLFNRDHQLDISLLDA